jgi:hypothetical protein
MKGIVFRLFEEFVCIERGPDFWEEVVSSTTLVTKEPAQVRTTTQTSLRC